jgi:oligopeptide transport system permease protein
MTKYILKRFLISLLTVWVLVTAVFILVRTLPGDPFTSEKTTPEIKANMMKYYGFDKPLHVQYAKYISNLLRGDLGTSLKYHNMRVNDIIAQSFPYSADLGLRALIFAVVVGLTLGINAALNMGRFWDFFCIVVAIIGVSVPDFILGSLLQYVFALQLKWLPVARWMGFKYTILPVFGLSLYTVALITRLMRVSMLEVINQDYITTAEAKGLSTFEVVWRHQIRNAILPVVTVMGPITAAVLTGTFVIEMIFAVPGMGKFYVQGIHDLDYSLILGMTVFYGVFLVAANFIVDIIYGLVDPRIRITGK